MNNAVYNSLTDYARMTWFLRLGAPNVLASMGRVRVGNGGLTMYFIRGKSSPAGAELLVKFRGCRARLLGL